MTSTTQHPATAAPTAAPTVGVAGLDKVYLHVIISWLRRVDSNRTLDDYSRPFVWPSLKSIYPLFVFLHACVAIIGSASNCALLVALFRRRHVTGHRRHRDPSFIFLANLALSDLIKAAVVLPLTVANLTIANWIYGSALCFLLPMMHSLPVHASMLTHVVMAIDRYRLIVAAPMLSPVPARACVVATWIVAGVAVMPYVVYVKYIDLGATLGPVFDGVGICCVNLQRDVKQYVRAAFVCMYCLPLAVVACLYVRISVELKSSSSAQNRHTASLNLDNKKVRANDDSKVEIMRGNNSKTTAANNSAISWGGVCESTERHTHNNSDYENEDDIDTRRELRTQSYLTFMVVAFALCWCPLEIMMLVTHFIYENHNNGGHFDITYLLLTLCGYLSTCVNAPLFASWRMSQTTRERLRGYLRLSNRNSLASNAANVRQMSSSDEDSTTLRAPIKFTTL